MDYYTELVIGGKLLLSTVLGGIIGFDREKHGGNAGIRTYASVCLGAALFTCVGYHFPNDNAATSRIIANIITGVGFIGAGIIFRKHEDNTAYGLTTAATIWATSGIGVAVGSDMPIIAIFAAVIIYFLLSMHQFKWYTNWKNRIKDNELNNED